MREEQGERDERDVDKLELTLRWLAALFLGCSLSLAMVKWQPVTGQTRPVLTPPALSSCSGWETDSDLQSSAGTFRLSTKFFIFSKLSRTFSSVT